jgi:hypothetical protein
MIKELTKGQESKLVEYANEWIQKGLSPDMPEQAEIESIIGKVYAKLDVETPPVKVVNSPFEAARLARKEYGATDTSFVWMNHDVDSASFYSFFKNEVPEVEGITDGTDLICDMTKLGWTLFYDKVCIVSKKPIVNMEVPVSDIRAGKAEVCHNLNGPAIDFGKDDPSNVYMIGGVVVESYVVDNPEQITVSDIEGELNAEVRRVKIDQYGQSRYLQDAKAEVVNEDDFGTLYKKSLGDDESLMMVKVVNSTAEPDGTFKDYFIRVDPNAYGGLKTARAAVASTWRNDDGSLMFDKPEDYCDQLVAQT